MKQYMKYGVIFGLFALFGFAVFGPKNKLRLAYNHRMVDAYNQTIKRTTLTSQQTNNGDLVQVPNFGGSFTKLFEHDVLSGNLTSAAQIEYKKLLKALKTGKQSDYNAIHLAPGNKRVLSNPQAASTLSNEGADSSSFLMLPAPNLSSAHMASDMLETYGMMICRDIHFEDYGTGKNEDSNGSGGSITSDIAAVLNSLENDPMRPRGQSNTVDAHVLFRGSSAGDLIGPYVSQYLIQPLFPYSPVGRGPFVAGLLEVSNLDKDIFAIPQRMPIANKREFGVSWNDFIAIQNGQVPKEYAANDYNQTSKRYLVDGRDMGSYVNIDSPCDPYYSTLNILIYRNFPFSPVFPYTNGSTVNEGFSTTMGAYDIYALVGGAMLEALKAAWYQKWHVHVQIRPEAVAGLVHKVKETGLNPYNLHQSFFDVHDGVDILALVLAHNKLQATAAYDPQKLLTPAEASTYLLAQMYPEGSPVHPSYPAAHATIAGACTTVIKAIFNDTVKLITRLTPAKPNPADSTKLVALSGEGENDMIVGSELDKLASNVSLARCFAGLHFRADCEQGIRLGEEVAICYLQSRASQYSEEGFIGFELAKRDGTRIRITKDAVIII